ncbi:MAG: LptF/LptG family permease [Burkholderiales bacterium]|nr:LptF/LptG family permease [Phycisphaerae bacterium]
MSRTLFNYVFWQLLKVFGIASAVLAGIMTFGGLLRPLTEQGLDLEQVGQMLVYAWPGMSTYSLPIAALFATTIVYGRLASDNEVTAVRAAGISLGPLGLGMPALVMGLLVALLSVASLSFIVPAATLKVERTVVSNIGQFVVNRISQQHQVKLMQSGGQTPITIYARSARLEPPDPKQPGEQIVSLDGVSIATYTSGDRKGSLKVLDEIYIARQARAYIRQPSEEEGDDKPVLLRATLERGMKFPRSLIGRGDAAIQGGVGTYSFGPIELRSPLRENTKFMDMARLKDLLAHPEKSQRMNESLRELTRADQQREYLALLHRQITAGLGVIKFKTAGGVEYTLQPNSRPPILTDKSIEFPGDSAEKDAVKLFQTRQNAPSIEDVARSVKIRCFPDPDENRIAVSIELMDSTIKGPDYENPKDSYERNFSVAMPEEITRIRDRTAGSYLDFATSQNASIRTLRRNLTKQDNSVISELHSRVSFAISCLVLTMVGYGLGVMFKSGNYLTAFAVSVVPALVSIVLIVTGQHICENVPPDIAKDFKDPLHMGLVVIWTGNAIVLGLAVFLLAKLRRT